MSADTTKNEIAALLAAWSSGQSHKAAGPVGLTAAQAIRRMAIDSQMSEAIETMLGKNISARRLGKKLSRYRGRIVGGRQFVSVDPKGKGIWVWRVVDESGDPVVAPDEVDAANEIDTDAVLDLSSADEDARLTSLRVLERESTRQPQAEAVDIDGLLEDVI